MNLDMIVLFALLLCLFALIRNIYTFNAMMRATELVCRYAEYLIFVRKEYDIHTNYYETMIMGYMTHFLNIFLWGKYSAIAPEYVELLKQFDD